MTEAEKRNFTDQKIVTSERSFERNVRMTISTVRDHFTLPNKQRRDADNTCNFSPKQADFVPVFFNTRSYYDSLVLKTLIKRKTDFPELFLVPKINDKKLVIHAYKI